MSINNITRNDTIDEWRVQTNQSANTLNTIESGDYTKTSGSLFVNGASRIVITSSGTPLEVANAVLFQTSLTVGTTISLGVATGQGNLTVGGTTTVLGNVIASGIGNSLIVANSATIGKNVSVTNSISGDNLTISNTTTLGKTVHLTNSGNTFYVNSGAANIQTIYTSQQYVQQLQSNTVSVTNYLDVAQNVTIGSTLTVTGNATVGNLNTGGVADSQTLRVVGAGTIGDTLTVTGNTTVGNLNTSGVANSQTLRVNTTAQIGTTLSVGTLAVVGTSLNVGTFLNVASYGLVGTTLNVGTALQTGTSLNVGTLGIIGTSLSVGTTLNVTGNATVGNLNTGGVADSQTLRVVGAGTIGGTLDVTGNATVGNLNTDGVTNTQTLIVDTTATVGTTLTVTGNTTVGNLNTGGVADSQTLRVVGAGTIGGTLDVTGNTTVGNLNTGGVTNSQTLRVVGDGSVGTTLTVTGNTTVGNLNTGGVTNSQTLRVVGDGSVGTTLTVTGNTTVGNLNTAGVTNSQTLRVVAAGTIGTTLDVTGNTTVGNLNTGGVTNSQTLRVVGDGSVGTTFNVTGNTTVGNLNTAGVANSQTLLVVSSGSIGTTLTVTGNTTVGNLNTGGVTNSQTLRVVGDGSVGTTLTVTGNTTVGNLNTGGVTNSQTLRVVGAGTIGTTLDVTGNTTVGNLNTGGVTNSQTLLVVGAGSVGTTLTVTGNTTVGNLNTGGVTNTQTLLVVGAGSVGTTLAVTGNATVGNLNTGGVTDTQTLRVVGDGSVGTTLTVTGNTTVGNLNTGGVTNSQTLLVVGAGTIGSTLDVTGNASAAHFNTTGTVNAAALRITTLATVTGNVTAGNLNTTNAVSAGTLVTTGRADIAGILTAGATTLASGSVTGNFTVGGSFIIQGATLLDTNTIALSANTPTFGSGFAYISINRGESVSSANANAHIRWNESVKYWDIRDVDNTDAVTSYSKILTANVISTSLVSTSTGTVASSSAANTLNSRINDLNTSHIIENTSGNLWLTAARVRDNISHTTGTAGYTAANGVISIPGTTAHITEATSAIFLTAARVRANVSNTTPINYDSSTGIFSHALSGVTATGYGDSISVPTFVVNSTGHVTSVTNVTIRSTSTSQTGVVQLTDSIASTSTTTAATPNAVKTAYDLAATKFNSSGGTISGDATITGNLTVSGETTFANTQQLMIGDNILTLNADLPVAVAPSENAGIEVNRGNSTNVYIRWDEGIDSWVANNGFSGSEFRLPNTTTYLSEGTNLYLTSTRVRANVSATTPISYDSGTGVFSHATSGVSATTYGAAAQVPVFSVNSFGHVTSVTNTAIAIASGAVSGLVASATTDTTIASNISSGTLNADRLPTSGVTAATYGTVSQVPVFAVDATGRITSVTNTAIAIASGAVSGLVASATTDTTIASNISSGTLNADRLPTSGVTAATHGAAASVPVFVVDAKGRITSVTNTAIAIASGSVSGLVASATTDTTNASNIISGTLPVGRLPTSGVTAATYGTVSQVPVFVVDATGRITSVSNTSIAIASGAVSGLVASATTDTTNASNIISGTLPVGRLPTSGVTAKTYGTAAILPVFAVDATGRITSVTNTAIAIASGSVSGLVASATTDTTNASNIISGTLNSDRLPTSGVTAATHGAAASVPVFVVDAKGRITSVTNTAIAISYTAVSGLVASATTDTTSATNISSGTLNSDRLPTSGVTAATHGAAASVPVFVVDAKGRITSVTNTAIAIASGAVSGLVASATTDTTNASNISSGTLPVGRLPTTGTAATYGDSVSIPVFTTDAYGRVSSVTNTAIRASTTSVTGIVQLTDSYASTSTTTAATPNAVKTAYDLAATKISTVTITNGTGISGGTTSSSFTLSIGQDVATTANVQFRTIGVGTAAASASAGSIIATGDITAFYSDERLKENIVVIEDALNKVNSIRGVYYTPNDVAVSYGYNKDKRVGVIAQDIEKVLPEIVVAAPFDIDENGGSKSGFNYKTVQYDKLVPLLIEAIKELSAQVKDLENRIKG